MDFKEEFVKTLGKIYYSQPNNEEEGNYILNVEKAEKASKIFDYCQKLASISGGNIETIVEKNKNQPAEYGIRITSDLVFAEEDGSLKEFTKMLTLCDGINISGTGLEDGSFLISFFINDLYLSIKK